MPDRPRQDTLDVVVPVYNERDVLPELIDRTAAALDAVENLRWRLIFVDDGSADGSPEYILERRDREPRLALVRLSRNFGHQAALSAGIANARADAVALMDADLQDPPEVIPDMIARWRAGCEVVTAERRSRDDRGLRGLGFRLFHFAFPRVIDFPVEPNAGIFGLLDRRAADQLRALSERNRFLPGLRTWIGFRSGKVLYDRAARAGGEPKQTLRRLIRYAMDGVLSFSYKPLRLMTYAGATVSLAGFALAAYFVVKRLLGIETAETGFTTLVTLILLMGGLQLLALGLLGEYLARIYDEVKNRPLYIVGQTVGLEPEQREPRAPEVVTRVAPRETTPNR